MNTPKIRFKGFTDDWEQRKFGELVNEIREKTKSENEDTLLSCAIDGMYLNSELFSHFRGSSNIGYLKVKKNDLILSAQNLHLGNCNVNLRFEHGIISPAYKVYELVDCNPLFIQAWVKQDSTKDFFLKASTEGASVCRKNIVWEELYEQTVSVPEIKEQEKIGYYFRSLDHLITLHQRKCDETKQLKKFMLQKMFPKNGEKNPEIRFEGFTDDWEQRKVSDITNSYSGGTPKSGTSEYYDGNIPFIRSGEIYSDKTELFISELGMNYSSAKRVHIGDILYALYGATSGEVSRAKLDGAINQAILAIIPNQDINADFLVEWFRKEKDKIINTYLQGGQGNLSAQIIKELVVMIPSKEEQYKLGNYFTYINRLITLHQRKCEKLKELKKFMLQNMFV